MNSSDIDKVICEYLEKPGYFISKYEALLDIISENMPDLEEEDLREALQTCPFKSPDTVGLIALVCPPLVIRDIESVFLLGWTRALYKYSLLFFYGIVIGTIIFGHLTRGDIIFFGIWLVLTSFLFRMWTREVNGLKLLDQLSCKTKSP